MRSREAIVTWSPPVHLNGRLEKYRVFLLTENLSSESQLNISQGYTTVSGTKLCYTFRDLTPNTQYKVWVAAINIDIQELISPLGEPVAFRTIPEVSSFPKIISLSNITSESVVFRPTTVSSPVFQCETENAIRPTSPDTYTPSVLQNPNGGSSTSTAATAGIATVACLLFVALTVAVYFAIKYISLKKQHEQRTAKESRTEHTSRQNSRYTIYVVLTKRAHVRRL